MWTRRKCSPMMCSPAARSGAGYGLDEVLAFDAAARRGALERAEAIARTTAWS